MEYFVFFLYCFGLIGLAVVLGKFDNVIHDYNNGDELLSEKIDVIKSDLDKLKGIVAELTNEVYNEVE